MVIRKMSLPRRTFLRGMGAAVTLPWLDAMVPALADASSQAAKPLTRFGFVYVPHGMIPKDWVPNTAGADFEFPRIMKPLEPFRQKLTIVSNLDRIDDMGTGHPGASGSWLNNCAIAKDNGTSGVRAGTTIDQLIAKEIGQQTVLPSLELATEDISSLVGVCSTGYSCAYINTLCWATPTTPLPMEINPRVVFERMFSDAKTTGQRLERLREDRSILDRILGDTASLTRSLAAEDQTRVRDYLDNIREIERRIQVTEKQAETMVIPSDAPAGVPPFYDDHVALMFDLMVLAYQSNITRVASFMMARELSPKTYPQVGVGDAHHAVSHHQNSPVIIERHVKINEHHVKLFSKFIEKLQNTQDGDGSLLDHSMIVYGSGMSEGNLHQNTELTLTAIGGLNGTLKGNRHIQAAPKTPLGNALVGVGRKAGLTIDRIGENGESNGVIEV